MTNVPPKYALITGVSYGGLGAALAIAFLKRGVSVIATGNKLSDLDSLRLPKSSAYPAHTLALYKLELDVSSTASIAAAVAATEDITGPQGLDFLVNNAGYGYMMPLLDAPIQDIKKNFNVNVFGLLEVTQAFFPLLRKAKGVVVNQSSIAGQPGISQPFIGSYSATKTCVTDLSNTLRVELWPFDVKVVTLFTGDVSTPFWTSASTYHARLPESSHYALHKEHVEKMMRGETNPSAHSAHRPEHWAEKVVRALLKPNPPIAVREGALATIMWIVSCLIPVFLLDLMFRSTSKLAVFKAKLRVETSHKSR